MKKETEAEFEKRFKQELWEEAHRSIAQRLLGLEEPEDRAMREHIEKNIGVLDAVAKKLGIQRRTDPEAKKSLLAEPMMRRMLRAEAAKARKEGNELKHIDPELIPILYPTKASRRRTER